MAIATNDTNTKEKAANFLEEIIQESIAKGDTRVQTRFPPANRLIIKNNF